MTRARLLPERPEQTVVRIANLALFGGQVFAHILRERELKAVMAATTPPIFIALTARIASMISGAKFVYHMQDIYPEVMAANAGKPLAPAHRVLQKIDAWTTRRADRVVVLSRDMRDTLEQRHQVTNVRLINNFLPDSSHVLEEASLGTTSWKPQSYQVVFAGNLGNFQGLDRVIDAFKILAERNVAAHLVLLGSGAAENELRAQAGDLLGDRIFFPGRVGQAEAETVVAASDLALVTLNPGVIRTAFPSKTMTYLSAGTPVLAAVEETSELAQLLESERVGSSCELDVQSIADSIESLFSSQSIASSSVVDVAESYASTSRRLPEWANLFGELDA